MNRPAANGPRRTALIEKFERGDIEADEFDHAAHLRLAWDYLARCDVPETLFRYTRGLKRLTERLGVPRKYHETFTGGLLLLIAERIDSDRANDFEAFRRANPDLFADPRALLLRHYTAGRLDSDLARRRFLLPNTAFDSSPGGSTTGVPN